MSDKIELLISGANNNSGEILNVYSPVSNNLISEIIKDVINYQTLKDKVSRK